MENIIVPLTKILRASIALRHILRSWNETKIVFIPKPGKAGYIKPKDFCPISFTSFILKTLERLVDRFIKMGPLVGSPLSPSQYAYRKGRSTDAALRHLVGLVEGQFAAKGDAIGAFLDVEGAFDSTSNETIEEAMKKHEIPRTIIAWIQAMLRGGTVTKANVCCGSLVAKGRKGGNKEAVAGLAGNFPEGRDGGHEDHTY
ncbi:uncharacterized protein LOC107041834 [Diachasma alloeum]|uniref:uncharacterized protein LOC107041834 n=1 Tax=Diachasma alloeum TaxID=454923 RepID=UPI00073846FB|nr:uncharacterized protein LOC107041834 [Diachasma alloeum]